MCLCASLFNTACSAGSPECLTTTAYGFAQSIRLEGLMMVDSIGFALLLPFTRVPGWDDIFQG